MTPQRFFNILDKASLAIPAVVNCNKQMSIIFCNQHFKKCKISNLTNVVPNDIYNIKINYILVTINTTMNQPLHKSKMASTKKHGYLSLKTNKTIQIKFTYTYSNSSRLLTLILHKKKRNHRLLKILNSKTIRKVNSKYTEKYPKHNTTVHFNYPK